MSKLEYFLLVTFLTHEELVFKRGILLLTKIFNMSNKSSTSKVNYFYQLEFAVLNINSYG